MLNFFSRLLTQTYMFSIMDMLKQEKDFRGKKDSIPNNDKHGK